MKLIDAPIGIFRFDGELVLKTEYCSENKLSGKYIPDCYIVRTGEYFWGSAKTANELNNLDVEPVDFAELLPTVTDTISRQQAIEEIERWLGYIDDDMVRRIQIGMKRLPSAQPEPSQVAKDIARITENGQDMRVIEQSERIKSKWVLHTYMPHNKFCMACRNDSPYNKRWDFCPKCGVDMRGEQDD